MDRDPLGYGIVDLKKRQLYLPRLWSSRAEAEHERELLLRGYPPHHDWRARLRVLPWSSLPRPDERDVAA